MKEDKILFCWSSMQCNFEMSELENIQFITRVNQVLEKNQNGLKTED
jgi:hypothetical protein